MEFKILYTLLLLLILVIASSSFVIQWENDTSNHCSSIDCYVKYGEVDKTALKTNVMQLETKINGVYRHACFIDLNNCKKSEDLMCYCESTNSTSIVHFCLNRTAEQKNVYITHVRAIAGSSKFEATITPSKKALVSNFTININGIGLRQDQHCEIFVNKAQQTLLIKHQCYSNGRPIDCILDVQSATKNWSKTTDFQIDKSEIEQNITLSIRTCLGVYKNFSCKITQVTPVSSFTVNVTGISLKQEEKCEFSIDKTQQTFLIEHQCFSIGLSPTECYLDVQSAKTNLSSAKRVPVVTSEIGENITFSIWTHLGVYKTFNCKITHVDVQNEDKEKNTFAILFLVLVPALIIQNLILLFFYRRLRIKYNMLNDSKVYNVYPEEISNNFLEVKRGSAMKALLEKN